MLCRLSALSAIVLGPCFVALAHAQAASAPGIDKEAMERAQRDADKVFMMIRQSGEASRSKPAPKAEAAAPPPPRPVVRHAPPAKAEARAEPAKPAADAVKAPSTTASLPSTAAVPAAPAASLPGGPRIFDFEHPLASFKVNGGYKWGDVRGAQLRMVERQGSDGKSIQAKTPEDSWFGQDFDEPRDWSGKKYLHFQAQSALGFDGKMAFKTGSSWDWCDAHAVAGAQVNGFTQYRVALDSKACPQIDRSNVRGVHLWVRQGDTLTMDSFGLE